MRKRKRTRDIKERIDEILIAELEIEHDEEPTPSAPLDSFIASPATVKSGRNIYRRSAGKRV